MCMKNIFKIIVCLGVALLAAGIVAYILYGKRVDEWRQVTGRTLENTVSEEVSRRLLELGGNIPFSSHGSYRSLVESDFPLAIGLKTGQGNRQDTITWEDSQRNITQDPDMRTWHSMLFLKHSLSLDTLSRNWNDSLRLAGFSGKGLLRVRTLDLNSGVQHCVYTGDSLEMARADSLSQLNIGYACEIEVTGFLLSSWWEVYSALDWTVAVLLALAVGGFGLLLWNLPIIKERYWVKKVEEKKTIYVATMELNQASCYRFADGTLFDREQHLLQRGGVSVKLPVLLVNLLDIFVEAKGNSVPTVDFMAKLWASNQEDTRLLYTAINRLKKSLNSVSADMIIENEHGAYRLVHKKQTEESLIMSDKSLP